MPLLLAIPEAGDQTHAGQDQAAALSFSETPDAKGKQVTALVPGHPGSVLTIDLVARHRRSGQDRSDPSDDTALWSF